MKLFDYVFGDRNSKDAQRRTVTKIETKALHRATVGMEYEERKTRERIARKKGKRKRGKK